MKIFSNLKFYLAMRKIDTTWMMAILLVVGSFNLSAQPTSPAGYDWQLINEDNFDGTSLDTTYWGFGSTPWGSENQSSCTWIAPEDTYLENGNLVLRSRKGPFTAPSGTVFDQTSGWAWIKTGNWKAYGYLEIRAQFPNHQGAWPAFWMLKEGWPPEIDVAEYRGSPKNYLTTAFYDGSWYTSTHPGDYSDWHTYALEWSPGELKFYMDGEVIKAHGGSTVPSDPMYVILSNGTSCADGDGTGFPNYFNVDYFRWYQTSPNGNSTVTIEENATGFCNVDGTIDSDWSDIQVLVLPIRTMQQEQG